jgi:hypothetical protein
MNYFLLIPNLNIKHTLQCTANYFASTVAFEMLTLSNQYARATTDAERSLFLAAGQAMLVTWQGTAFDVSYVLSALAVLIVSAVMLRSHHLFSKVTAYAGLSAGVLMSVPPTAGMIGVVFSLLSLVPLVVWLTLIARRLLRSDISLKVTGITPSNLKILINCLYYSNNLLTLIKL